MSLPIPNLDDRSFEDLLQEAKSLIPIYNKDWTNHNPSDPGITLLELFAWLSEMVLYRINQVPEQNYRKFLELLGVKMAEGESLDSAIERGLASLNQCYRAITTADFETLTMEALRNLQPDLNARVICMMNRDLQYSKPEEEKPGHVTVIMAIGGEKPVLSWDHIPGAGNGKLLDFLRRAFGLDWLETAVIAKSPDEKQIKVTSADLSKTVLLEMSGAGDRVSLSCSGFLCYPLLVQSEDGKSNVYAYGRGNAKPSDLLIRYVKKYLSRRKLITTGVHVIAPLYHPVKLAASLALSSNTNPDNVSKLATTAIQRYLDPLQGGAAGTGWTLGRFIHRSEIYQLLEGIPGVDHVAGLTLNDADLNQIEIKPYELIDPNSQISIEVKS